MESKVLILGAGLVSKPIIEYLLKENFKVTVAALKFEDSLKIVHSHPNCKAINWKVEDENTLDKLISESDIVVSLLPYVFHTKVARYCIKHKKNMVTTSYVSQEMRSLNDEAKNAGILILNEIGLDPGIDHMSAMRVIDHIHKNGGKVEEFYSFCGALAGPEAAENPFRYKFSWSPKGVVMAGNNDAKYLKNGTVVNINTKDLFKNPIKLDFKGVDKFEVYPNRDSLSYIDIYGIPEVKTMMRGTFRYIGWCESIDVIKQLNLLTNDEFDFTGKTYADFIAKMIGSNDSKNIKQQVAKHLNIDVNAHALNAIEWLGMFEQTPMNRAKSNPFEITSDIMIAKMPLGIEERDMVAMQHTFLASYPDGKKEIIKSSMLDFGSLSTDTAIARTVALPAAIAVRMILENKITSKGVHIPIIADIYNPVLLKLEELNIKMTEEYGLPLSEGIK